MQALIRRIPTKSLKEFAITHIPIDSPLRNVLLTEDEELEAWDFLSKVDVWLKLLQLERRA